MFSKLVRWTPKSLATWERKRQVGKKRFVWQVGVLNWGVPMFIFMTSFLYVQKFGAIWPTMGNFPLSLILINAVLWPIAGYWFGTTVWSTMEKAYRKHQEEVTR